ncbi:MAG: hypothetical protein HRT51_03285 [Colwellia sp.]|nr:hypothetical protein [Colwellia sp.]
MYRLILASIIIIAVSACQDNSQTAGIADSKKIVTELSCGATPHGENEQQLRYKTSSVSHNNVCEEEVQSRTCNDGIFNERSGTFQFESCSVDTVTNFFSCGLIAHNENEQRISYQLLNVTGDQVCEEETQIRTCNDGSFDEWSGTFKNETCSFFTEITIDSFEYQGGFRFSGEVFGDSNYTNLSYAPGVIAYNPTNHSLFIVGHSREQAIAEFAIPEIVNSQNMADFKVQENIIQGFVDFHETGRVDTGIDQRFRITGLALIEGKLIANYMDWYDASGSETDTTVVFQDANNLSTSKIIGPFEFEGAMHAAGWITPIPLEWQQSLGGRYVSGFSAGAILSRLSVGPSAFVLTDVDSLINAKHGTVIKSGVLLDFNYPQNILYDKTVYGEGSINQDDILYNKDLQNDLWTRNSGASHGFIVPGSNTYVTLGYSGGHESGLGYKITQNDGNLCGGPCPFIAAERYNYIWLWHVSDLLKVKQGLMEPHDVRPYEYGKFDTPINAELRGASYDADSGLLYVSLKDGDTTALYSRPPLFYVYKIN